MRASSIWDWWRLPGFVDPRYTDYARANASIGINGTVLNNVNAKADMLSPRFIEKAAAIADVLRPWDIRVYLSARFSAPIELGGLPTADPLDAARARVVAAKADEIYAAIPDFGGFLVKANSEGQPGPQDYGRDHADGANMLAEALAPHGGIVMWRAFVYSDDDPEDRVKQAYSEFEPLDGQFAENVSSRSRTGRSISSRASRSIPCSAPCQTPLMMEFQITKEYLGFSTRTSPISARSGRRRWTATPGRRAKARPSARVVDGSLHDVRHHRHRRRRQHRSRPRLDRFASSTRRTGTRSAVWPGIRQLVVTLDRRGMGCGRPSRPSPRSSGRSST